MMLKQENVPGKEDHEGNNRWKPTCSVNMGTIIGREGAPKLTISLLRFGSASLHCIMCIDLNQKVFLRNKCFTMLALKETLL
jgi:hypothetical protein